MPDPATWVPFEDHQVDPGLALDNGHAAADEWLLPDDRPPATPTDPGLEHRRVRAVTAYCEHFCDPPHADAKAGQALELFATRIRRRPNADEHSANLEVFRITRTVAAEAPMLDPSADGWRDKLVHSLAAERHADCVRASELLAARANDELDDAERDELQSHLRECEQCSVVERRMLDAEQAFVVALEADAPAPLPETFAPAPRPESFAQAPRPDAFALAPAESDPPRVVISDPCKHAVEAYCAAVCGASAAAAAADAWSPFQEQSAGIAGESADAEELRLIALTRAVAARHLSSEIADDPGHTPECVATPRLLAARLNDLIDEPDLDALEHHLRRCPACRGIQTRMIDAERQWSRELGHPVAASVALAELGQRNRRIRPVWIAVPAALAGLLVAIVLVSGSGGRNPSASTPPKIAQPVAITSSTTTASATRHAVRHHAARAHKARHAATTPPTAVAATPATTAPAALTQTTASTPQQATPTYNPPPSSAAPAPVPSPPTSSPPSFSNPSSAVGAAPAPQHHISGGGR